MVWTPSRSCLIFDFSFFSRFVFVFVFVFCIWEVELVFKQ